MHTQVKCQSLKPCTVVLNFYNQPYSKLPLPNSDIIKLSSFYILVRNFETFVFSIKEALGSEPQGPVFFTNPYTTNFPGSLARKNMPLSSYPTQSYCCYNRHSTVFNKNPQISEALTLTLLNSPGISNLIQHKLTW